MSQIEAIHNAIEFAESNLQEPVSVTDMAEAAGYSVYHFCRVFSQVAHHSAYDYLMRRRLSEAAQALLETNQKITDIGLNFQFNSPETFSRAFKRMFNQQPNQWRKDGTLNRRCWLSPFSLAYLQHINQGDYLKPVLAQKKAIHLIGLMTQINPDEPETVTKLWDVLRRELATVEMPSPTKYCGLTWYPSHCEQNVAFYLAGFERKPADVTHPGLINKTVPSQTFARFIHHGEQQTRHFTLDYIYQTWLPQSNQQLAAPLEVEYFGEAFPSAQSEETRFYVPLKPYRSHSVDR